MKTAGILQAALLLLLLAFAASCEVSKEYANRVFKPQPLLNKNDSTLTVRFMDFDSGSASDTIELAKVFGKAELDSSLFAGDSVGTDMARGNKIATKSPEVGEPKTSVEGESKKTPKNSSSGTIRTKRVRQ